MDLTGIGSIFDFGSKILEKVLPDPAQKAAAQLELVKLTQTSEFKEIETALAYSKAQTDINLVEAQNTRLFVAGPRPFLMWVGGFGVAYQWLLLPLGTFMYTIVTGHALPVAPPEMDPNLMLMLSGLMGLQIGARSYEKVKGVA